MRWLSMRWVSVGLKIGNGQWTQGEDCNARPGTAVLKRGSNGLTDVWTGFQVGSSQQVIRQARMHQHPRLALNHSLKLGLPLLGS